MELQSYLRIILFKLLADFFHIASKFLSPTIWDHNLLLIKPICSYCSPLACLFWQKEYNKSAGKSTLDGPKSRSHCIRTSFSLSFTNWDKNKEMCLCEDYSIQSVCTHYDVQSDINKHLLQPRPCILTELSSECFNLVKLVYRWKSIYLMIKHSLSVFIHAEPK